MELRRIPGAAFIAAGPGPDMRENSYLLAGCAARSMELGCTEAGDHLSGLFDRIVPFLLQFIFSRENADNRLYCRRSLANTIIALTSGSRGYTELYKKARIDPAFLLAGVYSERNHTTRLHFATFLFSNFQPSGYEFIKQPSSTKFTPGCTSRLSRDGSNIMFDVSHRNF
jgi:hypothetical protein